MLKISEVYEKQVRTTKERSDGSEYVNFEKVYETREGLLNPEYIVTIHPYEFMSAREVEMIEGRFPEGTKFSKFILDGNSFRTSEIVVTGSFETFCRVLEAKSP